MSELRLANRNTIRIDETQQTEDPEERIPDTDVRSYQQSVMGFADMDKFLSKVSLGTSGANVRHTLIDQTMKSRLSMVEQKGDQFRYIEVLKRFKFNPKVNFVGDIEHPTNCDRELTFTGNRLWYLFIRIVLIVLVIWIAIKKDLLIHDIHAPESSILITLYMVYLIDYVMSFATQYLFPLSVSAINPVAKPVWVFLVDMIAIVPIYYFVSFPDSKITWLILRCKTSFLLVRLLYEFIRRTFSIESFLLTVLTEMLVLTVCANVSLSSVFFQIFAIELPEGGYETLHIWLAFKYAEFDKKYNVFEIDVALILTNIMKKFAMSLPWMCLIMFTYMLRHGWKFWYLTQVHLFQKVIMTRYNLPPNDSKRVLEYFRMRWEKRADHMLLEACINEQVFCRTTYQAMAKDRNIIALQHCPMFRNMNYSMLRYLAQIVTPRMIMKDVYLYRFPMRKSSMFYVASGEVHILSSEDGQTPVMKLTAGTCVGTFVLIRQYRSNTNFRTGTNCEIYEMRARDFCNLARDFPEAYKTCLDYVQNQIEQAQLLKCIKLQNEPHLIDKTLIWLKRELHRLKGMTAINPKDHKYYNSYLLNVFHDDKLIDVLFTKMNLSVLSISPRNLHLDLVFLQSTCPWAFHPEAPLIKFMWMLVFIQSIVTYGCINYVLYVGESWIVTIIHIVGLSCMVIEFILRCMTPVTVHSSRKYWVIFLERSKDFTFIFDNVSIIISLLCLSGSYSFIFFGTDFIRLWRAVALFMKYDLGVDQHYYIKQMVLLVFMFMILWNETSILISKDNEIYLLSYKALCEMLTGVVFMVIPSDWIVLVATSLLTSSYYLINFESSQVYSAISKTKAFMNSAEVKKTNVSLKVRLRSFLDLLFIDYQFLQARAEGMNLPDYIDSIVRPESVMKYILMSHFFARFPKQLAEELAICSNVQTFPENALILSRGVPCKSIYILIQGEACSIELLNVGPVKQGADLNALEVILGIPSTRHLVAYSTTLVLAIDYDKFLELLKKFPITSKVYFDVLESMNLDLQRCLYSIMYGTPMVIVEVKRSMKSCYNFHCVMYRESYEAYDYFTSFEKLGVFSFMRFVLLHATFHPEGKFYLQWERFRVVCICIGLIFHLIPAYIQTRIMYFLLVIDMTGFVDIYLRFHVCYYNSEGILVTHPWCTAKYYFFRSFITDFISVLPLHFLTVSSNLRSLLQVLRFIQMYRAVAYRQYINKGNYIVRIIAIMYLMFVLIECVATLIFELHCTDSTIYKLNCRESNSTSPEALYLLLIFQATSNLCGIPIDESRMTNEWVSWVFRFLLLFSLFWRSICAGEALHGYINIHSSTHGKTSTDVHKLIHFMHYHNMPKQFHKHVIQYILLESRWMAKYNIDTVLSHMNAALRRDLLFHVYGDPFLRHNHFISDYRYLVDFYKNVFLEARIQVCPPFGKFITLSDVDSSIYLIYRGTVDLTNAANQVIATLLPGAIFGNLVSSENTRQLVSATAKCNTQCFVISSKKLFEILDFFPKIQSSFQKYAKNNSYFIKSKCRQVIRFKKLPRVHRLRRNIMKQFLRYRLLLSVFLGNLLNIYQISTGENHTVFLYILYCLDILHFIGVICKVRMPVKNKYGMWRVSMEDIFIVSGSSADIVINVLATIPFEIIAIKWLPTEGTLWFSLFRVNRLLRIYNVVLVYWSYEQNICLSMRQLGIKTLFVFYEFLFFTFLLTGILMVMDVSLDGSIFGPNYYRLDFSPQKMKNLVSADFREQMNSFLVYYRVVVDMTLPTSPSLGGEPNSSLRLAALTICMLLCFAFNLALICHCYSLVFTLYRRDSFVGTIMFNNLLKMSTLYSNFIKLRVSTNARYAFNTDRRHNISALQTGTEPKYLRQLVLNSCFSDFLTENPIFKHCHPDFLRQVASCFKVVDIPLGYEVIHKLDNRKCMFFIVHGVVVAMKEDDDIIENYRYLLQQGDCFSFRLGLNQEKHSQFTFTCKANCQLLELEYKDWSEIVKFFPTSQELLTRMGKRYKDRAFLSMNIRKKRREQTKKN